LGPSLTATDLANSLLAGASGITLVGATYTGANGASGAFTGGAPDGIGINAGIILTSGIASNLFGLSSTFSNDNGAAGDAVLTGIAGASTFNASVLTIRFIPTASNIQFRYVFSSREYPQYVNSSFNDIFVFQVNGVNNALVPGTSLPVSINNVNCGQSGATSPGPNPTNCNLFRDNRDGSISALAVGGFTVPFVFTAAVNPGVENELRLAIADVTDRILDSAVFLDGGTFQTCGGPGLPACGTIGETIPEPSTWTLMAGAGGLALLALRRRRG
jgi:hypothetical protein